MQIPHVKEEKPSQTLELIFWDLGLVQGHGLVWRLSEALVQVRLLLLYACKEASLQSFVEQRSLRGVSLLRFFVHIIPLRRQVNLLAVAATMVWMLRSG